MKYTFTEKQLELALKQGGSFRGASILLNISKTTFRQQYLKSKKICIRCNNNLDREGLFCNTCLEYFNNKTRNSLPKIKKCLSCKKIMTRPNNVSNISWAKRNKCDDCLKEKRRECSKNHYLSNTQKYKDKNKLRKKYFEEYRKSENGKLRKKISNSKRRAQKYKTKSKNVCNFIIKLFSDPNKHCFYCKTNENLTIEHKIPLSKNGTHTEDNIVLACSSCNSRKGTKTDKEFLQQINKKGIKNG